jgi:hypothetical protein
VTARQCLRHLYRWQHCLILRHIGALFWNITWTFAIWRDFFFVWMWSDFSSDPLQQTTVAPFKGSFQFYLFERKSSLLFLRGVDRYFITDVWVSPFKGQQLWPFAACVLNPLHNQGTSLHLVQLMWSVHRISVFYFYHQMYPAAELQHSCEYKYVWWSMPGHSKIFRGTLSVYARYACSYFKYGNSE